MNLLRLSVLWRITLLAGLCLIFTIVALIVGFSVASKESDALVGAASKKILTENAVLRMQGLGDLQENNIQSFFMDSYQYGVMLSQEVEFLRDQAIAGDISQLAARKNLVEFIRRGLAVKPNLFGIYLVLDENVMPGGDSSYVGNGEAGSNEIGRLAVYWSQNAKRELEYMPLPESELTTSELGPNGSPYNYWYICPRENSHGCVLEPYAYDDPTTNKQFLVSSVSMPIKIDGKVIGVIGMDIRLQDIQDLAEEGHRELFDGAGQIKVVSSQGLIAGDSQDSTKLTQKMADVDQNLAELLNTQIGEQAKIVEQDGLLRLIKTFEPVPHADRWSMVLDVPMSILLEPATELDGILASQRQSITLKSSVIAVLAALFGLFLIWLTARGVSKHITSVALMVEDIASGDGDLTRRLGYNTNDELGRLSRGFDLFVDKLQPIIARVSGTAQETQATADQASSVATQTSAGMEQQFNKIEQVATATEELSATASNVARAASSAAEAAKTVDVSVQSGMQVISDTMGSIERLATVISSGVEEVEALAARSERIGSVLEVIRAIAGQTNLLALNAAIEAARAGDAGRGFSVVADEVRNLAKRTQESVEEIRSVIEGLQGGTEGVVTSMRMSHAQAQGSVQYAEQSVETLRQIEAAVAVISDMTMQIASAAEQQSAVAEDVTQNVSSIRDITESLSYRAKESAQVSHTLNGLASQQQELMSHFRV